MKPLSERLGFRMLNYADTALLYREMFTNEYVLRYLQWDVHHAVEDTCAWVEEMIDLQQKKKKFYWMVVDQVTGETVGMCSK